jgi:ubiquinone/menaquinone biosynthesis C-methylase UbiE
MAAVTYRPRAARDFSIQRLSRGRSFACPIKGANNLSRRDDVPMARLLMDDSKSTIQPDGRQSMPASRQAVKDRARAQFDSWSKTYDRSIVQHLLFQPAYRMLLAELARWRADDARPFDLLDIGCGTGSCLAMVEGSVLNANRLVGLDYSLSMCRLAHEKGLAIGEGGPIILNGDSEHLPFADASFDAITCSHSFHHYPHQADVIREMRRVLRPGGRLLLIDGFRDNVIGWVLFDFFITRAESTPQAKVFHAPWSLIRRYFLDAGFKDVRQEKEGIWAPILLTVGVA